METERRVEWLPPVLLAAMFGASFVTWPAAPDRIPVHWNLHGQIDRYGGRFEGLLSLPLVALAVFLFLKVLAPRIDPGRANYPASASALRLVRLLIVLTLAALHAWILLTLQGVAWSAVRVLPAVLGCLFVFVGNLFGKIRPNWFVGIRTPWTLTSKRAWLSTHRAGRWVFIGEGILMLGAAWVGQPWALQATLWPGLAGVLGLVVYSFLIWRKDPDRVPPSGTYPA